MVNFVLHQIDYVFFLYGLGLLTLSGICSYLSWNNKQTAAWQWLGVFGVLFGVHQWLDMVAMSFNNDQWCRWLQVTLVVSAGLCLCEFGRRVLQKDVFSTIGWLNTYALLLAGVAIGGLWGIDGVNATARYLLIFIGGMWTAAAFWRIAHQPHQSASRSLVILSFCFTAFAVVAGLIVPTAPFFPATFVNQASFFYVMGVPIEVFHAFLVLVAIVFLWRYMVVQRRAVAEMLGIVRFPLYVHGLAVLIIFVAVGGWAATNTVAEHTDSAVQKYYASYSEGAATVHAFAQEWQRKIATHRLVVIGSTGLVIFLLAGFLVGMQNSQDTNDRNAISERLYRTVVNGSPSCMQLLDRQGRCLAANPKSLEKIGRGEDEVVGSHFLDLWPTSAWPVVTEAFAKALCGRKMEFEADSTIANNETVTWHVVFNPVQDDQGDTCCVVEIATDITERRRVEVEMRRAKDAAEAATHAKSDFLANMSHEIRTPITAVIGYSDLLLDRDIPPSEHTNYLHTIRRNGEILLDLINDILDISKIEAGKLDVDVVPCLPSQIVADMEVVMRMKADEKGLKLRMEFEGPIPEAIQTDPMRLRQILINLVGNAIKFTKEGQVVVTTRLVQSEDGSPAMQFEVVDTGIGMTAEQIGLIFQPFTQAESSTSRRFGGTGLGLTISKRLANILGGDITVTSEPGKGSCFRLTVPTGPLDGVSLSGGSHAEPDVAAEPKPWAKLHCRVLLVEDGPDNQRLLTVILKKAGAEVVVAQNGREGVEMAFASLPGRGRRYDDPAAPFDVVLMDIQMPEMDGYEATRLLRAGGYTTPIIALSAHATTHAVHQCIDAGCTDYLAKPIDRELLLHKIALHVGERAEKREEREEEKAGVEQTSA